MVRWFVLLVNLIWLVAATLGNSDSPSSEERFEDVMQMVASHCRVQTSPGCVQFEFLIQLERILTTTDYEVLPGVYLSRGNGSGLSLPPGLLDTSAREMVSVTNSLNSFIAERLFHSLRTWSLSVYVFGNSTLQQLREVMDMYLSDNQEVQTGRKVGKFWKYMGGALITVAFSILSALISKALTMSIIALVLTLLGQNGNSSWGFGSPAASPAVAYRSPPPVRSHLTHSSEVQYVDELPGDAGGDPYVYVNRRTWKSIPGDDSSLRIYKYNHN